MARTTEEVSWGWRVNKEKLERGERREWLARTDEGWMELRRAGLGCRKVKEEEEER